MAIIYYPTGKQIYTRVVGTTGLSELHIDVQPDTIFVLTGSFPNTSSTIVFIQSVDTASTYPITASYTLTYFISSSFADTSSYSLNAVGSSITSSYALLAASLATGSTVTSSISQSYNPQTSISQGSCILRLIPGSGSYYDLWGTIPVLYNHEIVRFQKDVSGLSRDCATSTYPKYAIVYNTGPNNNKTAFYCHWNSGVVGGYGASVGSPTLPLWTFWVGRLPVGNTTTTIIWDGFSQRCGHWTGISPQIYAGSSYQLPVTGAFAALITGSAWYLQSFKYTGTSGCQMRINGTQSVAQGNGGGNATPGGFNIGCDTSSGNGGGWWCLEMMIHSNITDADAANIESYLMAKYEIPH